MDSPKPLKVGLLTGGGDCPGLNAVIRAIVQRIVSEGGSCVGILEGWRGLIQVLSFLRVRRPGVSGAGFSV